jgi:hypothetical protein
MKSDKVVTGKKGEEAVRSKRGVFAKVKLDKIGSRDDLSPRKYLRRF